MYKFSCSPPAPAPASVWGVKAREYVDISARGAYNILSGVAAVVALPVGSISVGVRSFQNGEGLTKATLKSLSYTVSTSLQGLSRTVIGFIAIIAGIIAGAGLELYDRFVCRNTETPRERGINVQNAYLVSQAEKTYVMLQEEYNAANSDEMPEEFMDPEDEASRTLMEHNDASKAQEELSQRNCNSFQLPSSVKRVEGAHEIFEIYTYESGLSIEVVLK